MKKSFGFGLILAFLLLLNSTPVLAATRHDRGSVVVDTNRTVYFLGADLRYPFSSMEVFKSWGHKLSDIQKANDADLSLPVGAVARLNYRPVGYVDGVKDGKVFGWVADKNQPNIDPLPDIYFDGPAGKGTPSSAFSVPVNRPDVNKHLGEQEYFGYYGFEAYVPAQFRDNKQHTIYVYGIDQDDTTGKSNVLLPGSPLKFKLAPATEGPTVVSFTADKSIISNGEKTGVYWEVSPANSMVKIDGGFMDSSGSMIVYPENTTAYTLVAIYNGQQVTQSLTITVTDAASNSPPYIDYFDSYDSEIKPGDTAELEWSTTNAQSVTLNGTAVATTGTMKVTPTSTTKYTLAATNSSGTVTKDTTVTVLGPAQARDEQRLTDISMIFEGILSYSYDNSDKFPANMQILVPKYLKAIPAPVASSGAPCLGSDNDYVYTPTSDLTNFTFRYCFEVDHTDLSSDPLAKAGVHTVNYMELLNKSKEVVSDARRMADVRQLMTGLELFYNDNSRYPTSLNGEVFANDGNPKWSTYITKWPTAATPPGGTCTASQNNYTYQQFNFGQSYQLTFCLGADTGGYKAGVRTADPSGIN